METLESSRVCRLCGKQSGISINIFDKNENHVKKINAVLPIMVHEMDLLPKHMCHRCSYKLEEFHKFYVDCLKTDADLKSQLSWMRKADTGERVGVPMVHIENIKIKVEPPDYDAYDMNSMVDNVNYINSMSSVTFPVDGVRSKDISKGITYAAYARCGCYCDKPNQSNEKTVPEHFDNGIPKCSRISDVRSGNNSCVNNTQTIRTNFLAGKRLEEPTSLVTFVGGTTFNVGPAKGRFPNANDKTPGTAVVRNLRPRKSYVNYVGSKRKGQAVALPLSEDRPKNAHTLSASFTKIDTAQIKVEKLEEIAGRILRPRKGAVDYIGPKRKYSRTIGQNLRSHGDKHRSCKTKVRNISNKLKSSTRETTTLLDDRINVTIKKEQVSDFEDFVLGESVSVEKLPKQQLVSGIGDLIDQIGILPNDRVAVADLRNDPINRSTFSRAQYADRNYSISSRCKHSKSGRKGELKSGKIAERNCSAKYMISQNIHRTMRSGKIRKLESVDVSARRLRRSLRTLTENGKTTGRDLSKAIRGTVKKLCPSVKLPDNIKHYCEECNTSFANKELFKLHACYGH